MSHVIIPRLLTMSGVAMNGSAVLVGIIYDRYGTFLARVVTTLLVTFGLLIVLGFKFQLFSR